MEWLNLKKMKPSTLFTFSLLLFTSLAVTFLGCEGDYKRPSGFVHPNDLNRPDCRIGVLRGYEDSDLARRFFPNAQLVGVEEISDCAVQLLAGKLEAIVSSEPVLNVIARAYPLRVRLLEDCLDRMPSVVCLRANETNLLAQVNAFIDDFRLSNTAESMYLRWCQNDVYVPIPQIDPATNATQELVIGTSGLLEPTSFIDANGDLTGYDVEFGLRLAKALGRTPRFVLDPSGNLATKLRAGAVDVVLDSCDPFQQKKGIVCSTGYLETDAHVLVAEDSAELDEKVADLMLDQTRIGMTDVLIPNTRIRLFVNGFLNTIAITLLSAFLGFGLARILRRLERRLPKAFLTPFDWMLGFVRVTPPPVFILLVSSAVLYFLPNWTTAIVALAIWFAAFLEPTADAGHAVYLPVLGLRLPILLQWSSVVGYISVFDLTMAADLVCGRSFAAFLPLFAVALAYCLVSELFRWLLRQLERRFEKGCA